MDKEFKKWMGWYGKTYGEYEVSIGDAFDTRIDF